MLKTAAFTVQIVQNVENPKADFKKWVQQSWASVKKQMLSFLHFQFRKILLLFEGKKMRFLLSALQFGKELLEVKGGAEEKEFCWNVGLSPYQEAPEISVTFQHTKSTFYLNGSIHPQKRSFLGKVFKSGLSVFGRFYTHSNLFAFRFIGGLETLASEFAAGIIFAAVIVRGGNKATAQAMAVWCGYSLSFICQLILTISVSAYNKKWDRQSLSGRSISFFSWGLFCNSPLVISLLSNKKDGHSATS